MGIPQEHASGEGSFPQIGTRSVIIEQSNSSAVPEITLPLRPPAVEHVDTVTPSPSLIDASFPPRLVQGEMLQDNPTLSSEERQNLEQQLAFLQYLVSRGLVNEGFEEGKIPEQYRKKED